MEGDDNQKAEAIEDVDHVDDDVENEEEVIHLEAEVTNEEAGKSSSVPTVEAVRVEGDGGDDVGSNPNSEQPVTG
jgi:hypothetical protein